MKRITAFTLLFCSCFMNAASSAFDIPYGVQDPYKSLGFPACDSRNQKGPWGIVERVRPDGRRSLYLVILAHPFLDPANVICWIDGDDNIGWDSKPL